MSDGITIDGEDVAHLLALRLRFRRNPEARAIVDRCLSLVAAAEAATEVADLVRLQIEVGRLADDLALRFGAPMNLAKH